jgi:N utilization substance protein B
MGQTVSRTEAREIAVRVVFAGGFDGGTLELALDGKTVTPKETEFINKILSAVRDRRDEIDKLIEPHLRGWTLERLSRTDLAVLRTAAAELLNGETARAVVINECVSIAKKYGTENTGYFINGILAQIAVPQGGQTK